MKEAHHLEQLAMFNNPFPPGAGNRFGAQVTYHQLISMSGKTKDLANNFASISASQDRVYKVHREYVFRLLILRLRPLFESKYYLKQRLMRETDQIRSNRHIAQYLIGCITKEQLVHKKEHRHLYFENDSLSSSRKSANPLQNNVRTTYQYTRQEMRALIRQSVQQAINPPIPFLPAIPNPNLPVIPGVQQVRNLYGGVFAWDPNTRTGLRLPPGIFTTLQPHTRPIIAVGNAGFTWSKPHAAVNNAVRLFCLNIVDSVPRNGNSRSCHSSNS